jgi:hypothetical protein
MRHLSLLSGLVVFCLSARAYAAEGDIALFNGKDLTGWTAVLADPNAKAEDVWSVKDGILSCKGNPRGYLRTVKDDYADYTLRLQWRFPAGTMGGNSGVLVHASTPNALGIWPKSLEAQLNHKNAGDIWVIPESVTIKLSNPSQKIEGRRHFNLTDDSEKPIGEWNDYEITCNGDEVTIKVNGVLVNHGTKCSLRQGAICLQSEGAAIEFQNVRLTPLKK